MRDRRDSYFHACRIALTERDEPAFSRALTERFGGISCFPQHPVLRKAGRGRARAGGKVWNPAANRFAIKGRLASRLQRYNKAQRYLHSEFGSKNVLFRTCRKFGNVRVD